MLALVSTATRRPAARGGRKARRRYRTCPQGSRPGSLPPGGTGPPPLSLPRPGPREGGCGAAPGDATAGFDRDNVLSPGYSPGDPGEPAGVGYPSTRPRPQRTAGGRSPPRPSRSVSCGLAVPPAVMAGPEAAHRRCRRARRRSSFDLTGGEVSLLEQAASMPAHAGSLSIGQVMHRGPPRPRPSSLPAMLTTSMPCLRSMVFVATLRS